MVVKMDFQIKDLGECKFETKKDIGVIINSSTFVSNKKRLLFDPFMENGTESATNKWENSFELAGPREKIYFDPKNTTIAITTCGGLCPGLNDVIRSIVMQSYYIYGVKSILGIPYGYNGLNKDNNYDIVDLTPDKVSSIHREGGTILGSSRGGTDNMDILVDRLEELGVDILYTIGGDGTLHGGHDISVLAEKRGLKLSVIGVPKTIDNDISFIQKSFGFETAFSVAVEAISSAHIEAKGAPNGIGLVKLMGRHSGFIAANATLAMNDVNFVLVPEVDFDLYGENGFLAHLEERIKGRGHAVICIAEGAGQKILEYDSKGSEKDASGNAVLKDIGAFMKDKISEYFKEKAVDINLKYIDPSYIIRSAPAVPNDSIFCTLLGQYAVHAGMAGKTDMIVGQWNNVYTHVPIKLAISKRKMINAASPFWRNIIEATGQPISMVNK